MGMIGAIFCREEREEREGREEEERGFLYKIRHFMKLVYMFSLFLRVPSWSSRPSRQNCSIQFMVIFGYKIAPFSLWSSSDIKLLYSNQGISRKSTSLIINLLLQKKGSPFSIV